MPMLIPTDRIDDDRSAHLAIIEKLIVHADDLHRLAAADACDAANRYLANSRSGHPPPTQSLKKR
jgi:hypothetical protein